MPNIANVFKQEIARIARKEIKGEVDKLQAAASAQRKLLSELKRKVAALEKAVGSGKGLVKRADSPSPADVENDGSERKVRFSAARLAAQRKKLGLSANDFGRLIGVSGQSIYKWETKGVRPRQSQILAIAESRKLTKAEAAEKLGRTASTGTEP